MLKTTKELQDLIEQNEESCGCSITLPSGQIIGTTSGCFQPILYANERDQVGCWLSWPLALMLYNKEIALKLSQEYEAVLEKGLLIKGDTFYQVSGEVADVKILAYMGDLYYCRLEHGLLVDCVNLETCEAQGEEETL